ncbi:MAG: hypothetical protein ABEK50_02995 [bacterium]
MIDWEWFWADGELTEFGAAAASITTVLLFWAFTIAFFGGYGRKATTHTREESEQARREAIRMLQERNMAPANAQEKYLGSSKSDTATTRTK